MTRYRRQFGVDFDTNIRRGLQGARAVTNSGKTFENIRAKLGHMWTKPWQILILLLLFFQANCSVALSRNSAITYTYADHEDKTVLYLISSIIK